MARIELNERYSLKHLVDFRERQRDLFENPSRYPNVDEKTLVKIADRTLYRIAFELNQSGVDAKILADLLPRKTLSRQPK